MECQSEYIALAGVAVGALIGAGATLFAARLSWQRFQYNAAAARFRSAFTAEIYRLRKANEDVYKILNEEAFERQAREKIIFEPYLSTKESCELEDAWQQYTLAVRSHAPGNIDQRKTDNRQALERIERLISVAKPK